MAAPPTTWAATSGSPRKAAPRATATNASRVITTAVRLAPRRDSPANMQANATAVATP